MRIRALDRGVAMPRQTALLVLWLALPAAAADVRFDGSYRLRFNGDTNLALDERGYPSGQRQWFEHRLRLTPKIVEVGEKGGAEIQTSFDILSGEFAGDVASDFRGFGLTERSARNGFRAEGFDFRHLFAEVSTPFGLLEVGQMPSQWGMGMVANSGNGENTADFGDARFGDIVDRILFATRPLVGVLSPKSDFARELSVAVAADLVYRDRYANLLVKNGGGLQWGDTAVEMLGAAVYAPGEGTRAGLYITRRIQSYAAAAGDLHVWTFDAYVRHAQPVLGGRLLLTAEGEAAQIYGGTSHAPNLAALGTTRVSQQGAVLRLGAVRGRWEAELEGGFASGDSNPFDDRSSSFQMNRDYKVGLVLFDEVLMFQSQNAARRLSDPKLFGRPLQGLDLLPTEGAVSNALYLKPTLRFKPELLGGSLRLVGSALFARAAQPLVDPIQALGSSSPLNSFGHPAGQSYGVELDGAVSFARRISGKLGFEAGAQFGTLIPGSAFTRADGSRMPGASASRVRATFFF
jgi:hypothetical protein